MEINPFTPPSSNPLEVDGWAHAPRSRPIGVSILAFLHGLGGLAFGALFVWISTFSDHEQWLAQMGLSLPVFLAIGAICTALALASSIGMWLGAKWAWWLASWYYLSMLLGNVCQLLLILPMKMSSLEPEAVGRFAGQGGRAMIFGLLLGYLFKANVLRFFALSSMRKLKAIGILFGITLLFIVAMSLIVAIHVISRRG